MSKIEELQKKSSAASKSAGYDYQFYYFVYLILDLELGEQIAFEVKDDIHIDRSNGTTTLFQAKHGILTKNGETQNLSTTDNGFWDTISRWAGFIKADDKHPAFLDSHDFVFVSNKDAKENDFVFSLLEFQKNSKIDTIKDKLTTLKNEGTRSDEIKKYIENVLILNDESLKSFFKKITIEYAEEITEKVKNRIYKNVRQKKYVQNVYEKLCSTLHEENYLDTLNRKQFIVTCDEFNKKFGRCFDEASNHNRLPIRKLDVINFSEDLKEQVFIKQLLDIGIICDDSIEDIRNMTTYMINYIENIGDWTSPELNDRFLLPHEIDELEKDSILKWKNKFDIIYLKIKRKLSNGEIPFALDEEIRDLGIELIAYIRNLQVKIKHYDELDTELSNGHYYYLSNIPKIGWHYNWGKYKTE